MSIPDFEKHLRDLDNKEPIPLAPFPAMLSASELLNRKVESIPCLIEPMFPRVGLACDPIDHFSWIHSLLIKAGKLSEFNLQQCFFGEHLVGSANKIAIVESEKTAILASVYFPQFTWIASGGLCNLTREKARALSGKNLFLFPDKGCYNEWSKRANEIREFAHVEVSRYLEQLSGRPDGFDLGDLLTEPNQIDRLADGTEIRLHPGGFPEDWAA